MNLIAQIEQFKAEYEYWIYAAGLLILLACAGISYLRSRNDKPLHGEARFATDRETKNSGLYGKHGPAIGLHKGRILRAGGSGHCMLVAPTRGDKGVSVVVPTLATWHDSSVNNDTKRELHPMVSALLESYGHKVWEWAPFDTRTHRFNPLDYISDDPMHRVSSIQTIAYILYPRRENESMWVSNGRALFVALVVLVLECDDRPSTIGEVFRIAQGYGGATNDYLMGIIRERNYDKKVSQDEKGREVIEWVKKPPYKGEGVPPLSDECVAGLMSHIRRPEETAEGILSNMIAALQLWASDVVDAATSESDFDLRTFRSVKQAAFLHISPDMTKQGNVLLTLFYTLLIGVNMKKKPTSAEPYKILSLFDEFGDMNLPIVEETIGAAAGFGFVYMMVFQNLGQIEKPRHEGGYGIAGAKNLRGNCAVKVYFTPEEEDSESLSRHLGTVTVKARSVQLRNRFQGSESEQKRDLMMAQELRDMSQKLTIIKVKGCKYIQCKKNYWYLNPEIYKRFWRVSAKLNGVKRPTEAQVEAAADELTAFVPTLDVDAWLAGKKKRAVVKPKVRAATVEDVKQGISLDQLAIELPEVPEGKMTKDQQQAYADAFWAEISGEAVDYDTGEVKVKKKGTVDLSVLNAA